MKPVIDLRLDIEPDVLTVTVENSSERDVRLWARDNSWGWSMFSLLLAPSGSDLWRELTAKPIRWTANIPHALTLPAGGRLDYELRHGDPNWEGLDDLGDALNQPLDVRARLRIHETPEALAQGVFVGESITPPSLSEPPHFWLIGRSV